LAGLLVIAVYFSLMKRDVPFGVVCLACSYVVFSPLITYFILQFPKNTLGLIFFIFFITRLQNTKIDLRKAVITVMLFVATIMTHRMTGGFALIGMCLYAFRFISWKWILAGGVIVVALGFLPGILHISDFARFDGQFTSTPHWAPFLFGKLFWPSLDWLFAGDLLLITITAIAAIVLILINFRSLSIQGWTWLVIMLISLFPFFQFGGGAIGHRFFMITPIALTFLIAEIARPFHIIRLTLTGAFVILSIFSFRSYKPSFDAPNEAYIPIVDRLVERYSPRSYPLVIAHKSLAEIIIFKTDFDALNWLPPDDVPPENVLRIVYRVPRSDFSKYLDIEDIMQVKTIAMNYLTVPENVWQEFVAGARKDNDQEVLKRIYSGNNPMEKRPYFINKGRTR
jgi:hypothetical protein